MSDAAKTGGFQSQASSWPGRKLADLPIGHLQMRRSVTQSLAFHSIHNIGDVIKFSRQPGASNHVHFEEITSAIGRLDTSTKEGHTNWLTFWRSYCETPHHQFFHLCATCSEFERLSETSLALPVRKEMFGKAGTMLARSGITSIRILRQRLLEGIEKVPGLGKGKMNEFFAKLADFAAAIDADGNIVATGVQGSASINSDCKPAITSYVSSLPVGILRPGAKARNLREQGIETVGNLADIWPLENPNRYGLGQLTISKLEVNLAALQDASSGDETINWESYAAATGADLIPADVQAKDAKEFLRRLPEVISEIANTISDPMGADILLNRLVKRPGEQKTLDKIASNAVPRLTREAVRLKEKKLLKQIADGLIRDEDGSLNLIFREEFSQWWRQATLHFQDQEKIGFDDFVSGIAGIWAVDVADISKELPIILAIVTGKVQTPSEFWASDRLSSKFLSNLSDSTRQTSLSKFRLGKTASQLSEFGYETLGDLCDGCLSGDLFSLCPHPARRSIDHLNLISGAINDSGNINWQTYAQVIRLDVLPSSKRSKANDFARHLITDLSEMIDNLRMPRRASDVFRLRTSLSPDSRMSLPRVADKLGTQPPSIQYDESNLLQNLNNVLIDRNFSGVPFWIGSDFLTFWKEAEAAYLLSEGAYSQFSALIRDCWSLSSEEENNAAPSLWAVINRYPKGRRQVMPKSW